MIVRDDILSMEYFKKTEFTGCHQGMRFKLGKAEDAEGNKILRCFVWPEPFNFFTTADDKKKSADFTFDEDGIVDAIAWMNDRLFEDKSLWDRAERNWDSYK